MPLFDATCKGFYYTPFGPAWCDGRWIPDSFELPVNYSCWIKETNENWWFPQQLVRIAESMSLPRDAHCSNIYMSDELIETYAEHIRRHKLSPFYARVTAGR